MNILWTALITPLEENGRVDHPTLEGLLNAQAEAGNGVLLLGSTGEGINLPEGERMAALDTALACRPRIPLMVGLPGIEREATWRWLEYLERREGVDAYLAPVPPYAKPGPRGQQAWFGDILNASSRPVMLYNIPGRAGVSLDFDVFRQLAAEHPNLWALKESSGDPAAFATYGADASGVELFCGDDPLLPEFASLGAAGLVSVASNVWPRATRRYVERALAGELSEADKTLWKNATEALFAAGNPVTVKRLQYELGRIRRPTCRPPLSAEESLDPAPLLAAHAAVENWSAP